MNISSNGKMLLMATKGLSVKWAETAEGWKDSKGHEFEQKFLIELMSSVDRAAPVFDDLDKLISKVRSDCE
jgi:hypothetical protein